MNTQIFKDLISEMEAPNYTCENNDVKKAKAYQKLIKNGFIYDETLVGKPSYVVFDNTKKSKIAPKKIDIYTVHSYFGLEKTRGLTEKEKIDVIDIINNLSEKDLEGFARVKKFLTLAPNSWVLERMNEKINQKLDSAGIKPKI